MSTRLKKCCEMATEARGVLCRLGYVAIGAIVTFALVVSAPAGSKLVNPGDLDFSKALTVTIPYLPDDVYNERAVHFRHICCDCASTHDVIIFVRADGLNQNWWANKAETNKRRRLKGIMQKSPSDAFSAEHGRPSNW